MNRHHFYRVSSMNNWFPVLDQIDEVKTPETRKIKLDMDEVQNAPLENILNVADGLGGFPMFMRTDAASHKHEMDKASKLSCDEADHIRNCYYNLVNHNIMAGGGLPFDSLYLREWLDLSSYFKAFNQTPIAPELRFFIHNGEVLHHHFYWPEDSIRFKEGTEKPDDWKVLWRQCRDHALVSSGGAKKQAEIVADKFRGQGFWSVDFALTEEGDWYCIDMAKGEVSWHPKKNELKKSVTLLNDYEELYD